MRIALGVSGGVAAYKAAELVRRLQQERMDVQVVMTRAAQEFITPLTFAALSGEKVITDLFPAAESTGSANIESAIEHIAVAQRIDALVIVPATANILAKMARGIADDFLTTLYLATTAPVIAAPAMNVNMWEHAATQENIQMLRARGVHVVAPDEGYLACGMTGAGRLAGVEAIAHAAARRGARVALVSGPTALATPANVERIDVRSAEDMRRAVLAELPQSTIVIMAAAVADYRPISREPNKIKRGGQHLH